MASHDVELATVKEQLKAIQQTLEDVKVAIDGLSRMAKPLATLEVIVRGHEGSLQDLKESVNENEEYVNRLKGGFSLAVTLVTVIQGIMLAGAGWVLTTVIQMKEDVSVTRHDVQRLEAEWSQHKLHISQDK